MIRVTLPAHLRKLAQIDGEVELQLAGEITLATALDALEARYPMLRGTIREHETKKRRAFVRFLVCGQDWSHEPQDKFLPDAVSNGKEPLIVLGAIAGG